MEEFPSQPSTSLPSSLARPPPALIIGTAPRTRSPVPAAGDLFLHLAGEGHVAAQQLVPWARTDGYGTQLFFMPLCGTQGKGRLPSTGFAANGGLVTLKVLG